MLPAPRSPGPRRQRPNSFHVARVRSMGVGRGARFFNFVLASVTPIADNKRHDVF